MDPVQIGVREIYDLLTALDAKFDSYVHAQEPRLVLLDHRVIQLETRAEKTGDRRWLLILAVIASVTALLGSFVAPLIVR